MNLTKLKNRLILLAERPADRELLLRIADEVGHELTRGRPEVLRQFRAEADYLCRRLADLGPDAEGVEFARGTLTALIAVAKLVDLEHENEQQQDAALALVRRPLFREVMKSMRGASRTTTEVARMLNRDKAQVSRIFQELKAAGLIRAVDRGRLRDRREQPYRLSVTGILQLARVAPVGRQPPVTASEPLPKIRAGLRSLGRPRNLLGFGQGGSGLVRGFYFLETSLLDQNVHWSSELPSDRGALGLQDPQVVTMRRW